jgi:hypothetical protein
VQLGTRVAKASDMTGVWILIAVLALLFLDSAERLG